MTKDLRTLGKTAVLRQTQEPGRIDVSQETLIPVRRTPDIKMYIKPASVQTKDGIEILDNPLR
jgi:hypothetical protein